MMNIWNCNNWKNNYLNENIRRGIRLNFERGVDKDVRRAILEMVVWLRKNYHFPVRVNVYVKQATLVKASDGDMVPDIFFWPQDRNDEPYIKLATGDYHKLLQYKEKDDALATILYALLFELSHYFQWLNGVDISKPNLNHQASLCAGIVMRAYFETREHL